MVFRIELALRKQIYSHMSHMVKAPKHAGGAVKKKRRFNFVDFLLIVLILALIGGAIYLISSGVIQRQFRSEQTGTISYTVEIIGVKEEYLDLIVEGDAVVNAVSKNSLGTVESVDYSTKQTELGYEKKEDASDYTGVLNEYPDRYNVSVSITVEGEYVPEDGYYINGTRIAVGEALSLRFPNFVCEGHCISLAAENFQ